MGRTDGQAGTPPLAGARKCCHDVEGRDERGQIAREAVAEERWDAGHTRFGGCHDLFGGVQRPRSHHRRDHQPKFRGKADPDPLPPILAVGQTFPCLIRLTSVFALDEVPQLVELHLGYRQVVQQVLVDRFRLIGRTLEPGQPGLFCDAEHKADAGQINPDQEHFEGHHDLLFRGAEIEKDRLAGFSKVCCTRVTAKDASLPALGEIRSDSAHVTLCSCLIMSALRIGNGCPQSLGFRIGQSSRECDVAISLYLADWPFAIFKVLTGEHLAT